MAGTSTSPNCKKEKSSEPKLHFWVQNVNFLGCILFRCSFLCYKLYVAQCPKEGSDTVDGRISAPVDMVNIPLFTRFYTSQVVVWDF